jgi:hypothetical protein
MPSARGSSRCWRRRVAAACPRGRRHAGRCRTSASRCSQRARQAGYRDAVAGTTRDLPTERREIGGLAVTLIDTAGVCASDELIEQEGIARARQAAEAATSA